MSELAILHPMTLVGRELRERLESRPAFAGVVKLYSNDEEEVGTVVDAGGEAGFVQRAVPGALDDASLVIACGDRASDRAAIAALPPAVRSIVLWNDGTHDDGAPAAPGFGEARWSGASRLLSPAPAALLLARLLRAAEVGVATRAVATVVLPVSGFGQRGLDALFEETRALLTFTAGGKEKFFGEQVAFNLLPAAPDGAELEAQARALLGENAPALAVQSVQGGIFHGVSASVFLAGEGLASAEAMRRRLGKSDGLGLARDPERLGPVESAGDERLLVGDVRESAGGLWIWATMDNLIAGGAANALDVAEIVLAEGSPVH